MKKASSQSGPFDFGRLRAFAVFLWRRLLEDRCFETAGALSYSTLFAIVPALAAVFAILSAFPAYAGLRESVSDFVFRNFVPAAGEIVQAYLLQFAANAKRLTSIGVLVMLASAWMMMSSIEDRFNRIWRVAKPRRGSARFVIYWAALTLGPLVVVAGVAASSWVLAQPLVRGVGAAGWQGIRLISITPFAITWFGLTAMYVLIPNRRVGWRGALIGAVAAAILFELVRRGFALYVAHFASYGVVYGPLAVIPVFLIWIYLAWVIVLAGAILTAAMGAFDFRAGSEALPPGSGFIRLLQLVGVLLAAQRDGQGMEGDELLARVPFPGIDALKRALADLESARLVMRSEAGAWSFTADPAAIGLDDLLRTGDYRIPPDARSLAAVGEGLPRAVHVLLERAIAEQRALLAVPLRTLFEPEPAGVASGPAGEIQP